MCPDRGRNPWELVQRDHDCAAASAEGNSDIDGYSPHQADGQETSSVSRKRQAASRLPVRGSLSSLIHGAAVGTV